MNWFQLLIAILGSGGLTALITGHFNSKSNKENNIYNQQRFEIEQRNKNEERQKEKDIQKATALYNIIKPALSNVNIRWFLQHPNEYNEEWYEYITSENICNIIKQLQHPIVQVQINNQYGNSINDISNFIYQLLIKDAEEQNQLIDFKNRYFKNSKNIDIDIIKLNTDISFINEKLNLYIEPIKINNN